MPQASLKPDAIFHPADDKTGQRLDQLAWLMDRAIKIPGTNISIGLDALLGLLPVGGDVLTGVVQTGLVMVAVHRYRVPKVVAARMVTNVLLDMSVGAIPFVGDVFDVFFKANTRNIHLLNEIRRQVERGEKVDPGPSVRYLIGIGVLLGGVLTLVTGGFLALFIWAVRSWPWF